MQTEPSPTAAATRLTLPARTSPTANTPGWFVSKRSGGRRRGQPDAARSDGRRSGPVFTNPFSSSATQFPSQPVFGFAPVIIKTWRMRLRTKVHLRSGRFMRDKAAVGADLYIEDAPRNVEQLRADGHET